MRISILAGAAALLLLPTIAPANACGSKMHSVQAATFDYSAETDKTAKPVKKVAKKHHKPKAPKVEYMRAAPM